MTLLNRLRQIVDSCAPSSLIVLELDAVREWIEVEEKAVTPTAADECSIGDPTVTELAEALGKARSTITVWLQAGLIPEAYKLRGVEWRIPRAAVRAFLDRQPKAPSQPKAQGAPKFPQGTGDLSSWRMYRRSGEA